MDNEFVYLSNPLFDVTRNHLAASLATRTIVHSPVIRSATWFLPKTVHVAFGGFYTIFRFMNTLAERGVKNTVLVYENEDVDPVALKAAIVAHFPALRSADVLVWDQKLESIDALPASDIGICTFWVSAYLLLRFNQVGRKFYFIQDYEPMFYTAGSRYALAESSYRFGFQGIVNTLGLERSLQARYGIDSISFKPAVDRHIYFPSTKPADADKRIRIFFYARAQVARNAFELGILVIEKLLARYGDRIEIVTAGDRWNAEDYGLGGRVSNLGRLDGLQAVGDLYRGCEIGFVYMLSKHPSYQPFEFMASGMTTVSNRNEDNLWFLKDEVNCLLAEPSPAAMAEQIGRLVDDTGLRERIRQGGLDAIDAVWDVEIDRVWRYVEGSLREGVSTTHPMISAAA